MKIGVCPFCFQIFIYYFVLFVFNNRFDFVFFFLTRDSHSKLISSLAVHQQSICHNSEQVWFCSFGLTEIINYAFAP